MKMTPILSLFSLALIILAAALIMVRSPRQVKQYIIDTEE